MQCSQNYKALEHHRRTQTKSQFDISLHHIGEPLIKLPMKHIQYQLKICSAYSRDDCPSSYNALQKWYILFSSPFYINNLGWQILTAFFRRATTELFQTSRGFCILPEFTEIAIKILTTHAQILAKNTFSKSSPSFYVKRFDTSRALALAALQASYYFKSNTHCISMRFLFVSSETGSHVPSLWNASILVFTANLCFAVSAPFTASL